MIIASVRRSCADTSVGADVIATATAAAVAPSGLKEKAGILLAREEEGVWEERRWVNRVSKHRWKSGEDGWTDEADARRTRGSGEVNVNPRRSGWLGTAGLETSLCHNKHLGAQYSRQLIA